MQGLMKKNEIRTAVNEGFWRKIFKQKVSEVPEVCSNSAPQLLEDFSLVEVIWVNPSNLYLIL